MRAVARALYTEPVIFLGATQGAAVALAAGHVIAPWIPIVVVAITTPIQRAMVRPRGRAR
jgi:hypothetical protein